MAQQIRAAQTAIDIHQVRTRNGSLCMYAKSGAALDDSARPVLVMIHGALRESCVLFDWIPMFDPEFDVVLVDLPGHGRSPPIADVSVEEFAGIIAEALTITLGGRAAVVIGESLGGLVALAMGGLRPASVRGIVAADPPMTTAKLWHVGNAMSNAVASNPANHFLRSLAKNVFGVDSEGKTHERIYYGLVDQLRVPTLFLTGDVPLFPVRNVNAVPCLFDDVDHYVIRRIAGEIVQFERVPGCGHVLLVDAREACQSIIGRFCRDVLSGPSLKRGNTP